MRKKSFFLLFTGNLFGKIIGFLREVLLAFYFGTTAIVDAVRASQTAAFVPIHFVSNDALNAGLLPTFSRYLEKDRFKAMMFFKVIHTSLTVISLIIVLCLITMRFEIIEFIVPGFSLETKELVAEMIVVLALGIPFYTQSILFLFCEMAHKKYYLSSIRSSFQNIGLVIGTFLAFVFNEPILIPLSFSSAFGFLSFFSFYYVKKNKYFDLPKGWEWNLTKPLMKDFWRDVIPLVFLSCFTYSNVLIERYYASNIGVGSVASLEYAKIIMETGVYLISVPLGYISLAEFSSKTSSFIDEKILPIVELLLLMLIPVGTFLLLFSYEVIDLIFGRGQFNLQSIESTSTILFGMSIGIWAKIIALFLMKVLNAQSENFKLLKMMVFAYAIQILINVLFIPKYGVIIIGISDSIGGILLLLLLMSQQKLLTWNLIGFTFGILLYSGFVVVVIAFFLPISSNYLLMVSTVLLFSGLLLFKKNRKVLAGFY